VTAVVTEDGRWLVVSAAASGLPDALLARQAEVVGPVKAVAPAMWRAEMPECPGAVELVHAALAQAVERAGETAAGGDAAEILAAVAAESGMAWRSAPTGLFLRVNVADGAHSIAATAQSGSICFRTPLLRRKVTDEARAAMSHFLLALNGRLRLARAGWWEAGVVLEVALPAASLTVFLMEEAARALGAGLRMARRECASLLDGQVAKHYCEFHLQKEKNE
jgi:hypothetical protein